MNQTTQVISTLEFQQAVDSRRKLKSNPIIPRSSTARCRRAAKSNTLHPSQTLAAVYLKRSSARLKAGQAKEAIADVGEAVQLNPDDARAYAIRSEAYEKLGQKELARADAETVKRIELFQRQHRP
jgi:Flp pilus assembly protein TadD